MNGTANNDSQSISGYNLFYILERELFLQKNGIKPVKYTSSNDWKKYGDLAGVFPPLPSRYNSLELSGTWFIKRLGRSRKPYKNHDGAAISLAGLTKTISARWKCGDAAEEKDYVAAVAKILKKRHDAIQSSGKSGSGTKSPPPSQLVTPSRLNDLDLKLESEKKTSARRVSMNSSASSISMASFSTNSHHVPSAVYNALMKQIEQQPTNPYSNFAFPLYPYQQQQDTLRRAQLNAELNRLNDEVMMAASLGLSGASHFCPPFPSMKSHMTAHGQHNVNPSSSTAEKNIPEGAVSNKVELSPWLSEGKVDESQQCTEEGSNGFVESFLCQDPNKCGWLQADYFKSESSVEETEISMADDEIRSYDAAFEMSEVVERRQTIDTW
eukprot:scaffold77112_cov53-Cyclotella_meneghiniana.AAC.1